MYFVYIILCSDASLYTGITNNLERRFEQHKNGTGGHYTRSKEVKKIVYTEEYPDRSSALKREAQIKGLRREKKLNLIKFGNSSLK
jgi:putative endonuclease